MKVRWRLLSRILLIHSCRTALKVSLVCGIIQFAELLYPVPSVVPGLIGNLERSDLQLVMGCKKMDDLDTQGATTSMIASISLDGYSAERES